MTLTADYDAAVAKTVITLAIVIWKQFFFNVRAGDKQRKLNAGVRRSCSTASRQGSNRGYGSVSGRSARRPPFKRAIGRHFGLGAGVV